jgi:xylulokinase
MIIGLDVGSTGCKAILFNQDGNEQFRSYREYDSNFLPDGFVELDSNLVISSIKDCIKEITSNSNPISRSISNSDIDAICFSVFGGSLTVVSDSGKLLNNTIVAYDKRGVKELEWFKLKISAEEYYNITGSIMSVSNPLIKILWLQKNFKNFHIKKTRFLSFEEFIYLKFGITPKITYSLASNFGVFDISRKNWSKKIMDICGLEKGNFSEPVNSGEILGIISKENRKELGLKHETKIISGGFDQCCAALGSGAIKEGIVANGMGTVESFISTLDKVVCNRSFVDSKFLQPCHTIRDKNLLLSFVFSSGSIFKWYRDVFGYEDLIKSRRKGINFYDYVMNNIPEKPDKDLLMLPHFVGSGTPYVDPCSKGLLVGLTLETDRADIVRTIMEGIIFEVKLNMEIMENNGARIDEIRSIGGASRSDRWLQLKADILGKPIYRINIEEAGCMSGFILAAIATGLIKNINEAVDRLIMKKKCFYPGKSDENNRIYEEKFKKFKKLYPLLKEIIGNS